MLPAFFTFMNTQHFNAYDVILLVTFIQATTFTVLALLREDDSSLSYYLLPAFMGSIALGQLSFFFLYNPIGHVALRNILTIHQFDFLCLPFFLHGPLLYHYLRALTNKSHRLEWYDYTPIAIFLFVFILNPVKLFGNFLEFTFWRSYVFMGVVGFLVSCFYGVRCIYYIEKYSEKLKDRFCTLENIGFIWLKVFASGFFLIWFLEILPPFFYNRAPWVVTQAVTHSKNFIEMIMVTFVIFASLLQSRKIVKLEAEPENKPLALEETGDNAITKEEIDSIAEKLQEDKLYLTPGLTVEQLANHVDMPVKTLSLIINRYYEKNFFDFINHYRVEEARRLLKSPEHVKDSIQQIYEAVGFRSKSSFNTLFKKTVGVTPSKYREKYGKSVE